MKLFTCSRCGNLVYFENRSCVCCGSRLGYQPDTNDLSALEQADDVWIAAAAPDLAFRFCANADHDACNWLIPAASPDRLCIACRHNQTIPDLSEEKNLNLWRQLGFARHRLIYGLLRLRLPLVTRQEEPDTGLAFEALADGPDGSVRTGHLNGVITIGLAEADDATRERRRAALGEPYRTLLGHFRHETGHYYWDRLVRDGPRLRAFRAVFGDETRDYGTALAEYHATGAPDGWQAKYVSAYASAHPWEDFAETWAHYLHIVDTLEMVRSFGLRVGPEMISDAAFRAEADFDPHAGVSLNQIVRHWIPIAGAINNINRCMGQPDLYPFVLTSAVIRKLGFVHDLIRRTERLAIAA